MTDGTPVPALHVVTRRIDDAGDLLRRLPERQGTAWVRGGDGLVGAGVAATLTPGSDADRMVRTRVALDALATAATVDDEVGVPGTGLVAFVSFTFADGAHGSLATIPATVVGRRGEVSWVTRIATTKTLPTLPDDLGPPPAPQADRPRYAGSSLPDLHWLVRVAEAVERLNDPDADPRLQKVVLARDHALWAKSPFQLRGVTARLAEHFPECFTFSVGGLVGATPELLLRRFGRDVTSEALAGTAPRSADPVADAALGAALLASQKEALEHRLAADSVDEVLRPRCLHLDRTPPHLKRLENVQHVATTFTGTLGDATTGRPDAPEAGTGPHLLDLVAALHPTAAVGGTPREAAVDLISELEGMDRGRYAGPVGWVDARGDGELGIALRCAELSGARARLFAGAGIVAASLPEDELEETRVKLLAMQSVLGDG